MGDDTRIGRRQTDAPSRANADGKGRTSAQRSLGDVMTPRVRAIQASTGPISRIRVTVRSSHLWLLCQLVDSSARKPMTDVPSCEKPEGAARRQRTQDLRMGIPTAIASRNGERSELKHLSRNRKRTQTAISSVTASERDTVQTEAFGQCGVRTDSHSATLPLKSLGTERDTG